MFKKVCLFSACMVLLAAPLSWAAEVTVQWNPNSESDLNGYKLYYGDSPRSQGPYSQTVNVSDKTAVSANLSLVPGVYYFALTAIDTDGNESELSDEVMAEVIVPAIPGKPGQPILIQ